MGRNTARALEDARETIAAWTLRMAAADHRIAALERELAAERERSSRQQNEIKALESSLERHVRENLQLSYRLANAATEKRTSRLAPAGLAGKPAEAERNKADGKACEQTAALRGEQNGRSEDRLAAMQISLQDKDAQLQALRQAQLKLVELVTSREAALLRAEEKIATLTERLQAAATTDANAVAEVEDAWLFSGELVRAA